MKEQIFKTFIDGEYKSYEPEHIISGDTDSTYIDLSVIFDDNSKQKDIIKFADILGHNVNIEFPSFMKSIFNIPEERINIIQTEREVVSDKSLFLAKKKYVMHVVDEEGIEKNKLKFMGVEIKKTDTPIVIQNFLKDLVNLIMDKSSYEEIYDLINSFKKKYKTFSMDEIGRPTNIKTLNKYIKLYNDRLGIPEWEENIMKSFPYHVRASMFYNSKCSISDTNICEGEKIKIVYIKNPESKYIAFPTSTDNLPNFLNDFEIDWDVMWEKVQKKIDIYLKPVGYLRKE